MAYALKCLKNNKEIILICLEVFVKEPSLDWLMQSKKSEISSSENNWDPAKRIDIVRQKLSGGNPVNILIDELSSGPIKKNEALFKACKDIIVNAGGVNKDRNSNEEFSPEEQVSCLVRLATDKTILATTYIGWNSWF